MKKVTNPSIERTIIILLIFLLAGALLSCETPASEQYLEKEITVLIDLNNPNQYSWTNHKDKSMGWKDVNNGEGDYEFTIEEINGEYLVTLESKRDLKLVNFFTGTFDRTAKKLEINTNTVRVITYSTAYPTFDLYFK